MNRAADGGHYPRVAQAEPGNKRRAPARATPMGVLAALALVLVLAGTSAAPAWAQEVPPDADWRSLETPHFRVTFPAELETLARRAGGVAEAARARLAEVLADAPGGRVELVLTDHADISNGFATVAPYPRVVIFARPPVDGFALSHFDDWIELVVVHELAHIHHLDVAGVPGRVLRTLFGRVPAPWPFFPAQGAPAWVLEGLATWYESSATGLGRVHGTYLDMFLRTAALENRLESVDQASGRSPAWPAGQRPYAYGAWFFEWLTARYGDERMAAFVEAVGSQWVPYRLNAAARAAFGVGFDEAWELWRSERVADARALAAAVEARSPAPAPERLTDGARVALHGRMDGDGRLVYARADGRSDPQLRTRPAAAPADPSGVERERGTRTNGVAAFDLAPGGDVILAQLEIQRRYSLYSDLYRVTADGQVRRLTRGQRLDQPSLTPDGRHAWAVQTLPGTTRLVRVDLASGAVDTLPALPGPAHWGFPAVSPDGRRVAAIRWTVGQGAELVVLDAGDGAVLATVSDDPALELAPTWAPDGTLLWVSDRTGIPNLYAARPDGAGGLPGRHQQVTDVATGVALPSVDPTGRWIVFSLYTASGWELARIPWRPDTWTAPRPPEAFYHPVGDGHGPGSSPADDVAPADGPVEPYRAWRTLRPRHWEPLLGAPVRSGGRQILGPFLGLATEGRDAVGRHRLGLSAAFSTTGGRAQGQVGYAYHGLGSPVLGVSASQRWDAAGPWTVVPDEGPAEARDTLFVRERERRLGLDVTFLGNTFRRAWAVTLGGGWVWESRTLLDPRLDPSNRYRLARPDAELGDARITLNVSSARAHEMSVGTGAGWTALVRVRARREAGVPDSLAGRPGGDRGFDEILGAFRAYRSFSGPGFADHVLALQLSGGAAGGPGADAFHFDIGGAAGQQEPLTGLALFGGEPLFFPVRGYEEGWQSGRRAWTGSLEWRFPLALVNRGWGLFPLHLDRVHGALFVDAGNAWGPELGVPGYQRPREQALVGVGGELRLEMLGFYTVPLGLRVGAGVPLTGGAGTRVYLRFGSAF